MRGWYDDTAYHIPLAVDIARHLNPYTVDEGNTPFTSMWFPAAAETLVAVPIRLTGRIGSSNLSGAFSFALLLALTYCFAGLWSQAAADRLASVGLVVCIPLLLGQTMAFYVDIHLALAVCLALYLMCLSLITAESQPAYFAIAAALLAAAVKYHGLVYAAILLPAAHLLHRRIAAEAAERPGSGGARRRLRFHGRLVRAQLACCAGIRSFRCPSRRSCGRCWPWPACPTASCQATSCRPPTQPFLTRSSRRICCVMSSGRT